MNSQEKRALMEQWYRQYAPLVFHYACQFTDHHAAEEIVQETFRIAWEALRRQEVDYPKTWLRKIAENVMKNQFRQSRRHPLVSADELPEDALGRSEDPVDVELEYGGLISPQNLHLLKRLAQELGKAIAADSGAPLKPLYTSTNMSRQRSGCGGPGTQSAAPLESRLKSYGGSRRGLPPHCHPCGITFSP